MNLYKVRFEVELMVVAESARDAECAVQWQNFDWTDEIMNGEAYATEVTDLKQIKDPASLPWLDNGVVETGDETCAQVFERLKKP